MLSIHGLVRCFMSQLQYRNGSQNFISNFVFQFIKKMKWHFRDPNLLTALEKRNRSLISV